MAIACVCSNTNIMSYKLPVDCVASCYFWRACLKDLRENNFSFNSFIVQLFSCWSVQSDLHIGLNL